MQVSMGTGGTHLRFACKSKVRLEVADEAYKRYFDARHKIVKEFNPGDLVLMKNRREGIFETKLDGPYEFVRYLDA